MDQKKRLRVLSLVWLAAAALLMIFARPILALTQAGPQAPPVSHHYGYLHPQVYFAGGMYFAPLAVILAMAAAAFLLAAILTNKGGRVSFALGAACLVSLLPVVFYLPLTPLNLGVLGLVLVSTGLSGWACRKP